MRNLLLTLLATFAIGAGAGYALTWAEFYSSWAAPKSLYQANDLAMIGISGPDIAGQASPRAYVAEEKYNFGTLEAGVQGKHDFHVRNDGDAPLILRLGTTSCKCTLSNLGDGQDSLTVAPGETVPIHLTWDTVGKSGEFRQSAEIITNDFNRESVKFIVEGQITEALAIQPREHIFSTMTTTDSAAGTSMIYYFRKGEPLEISGFTLEDPTTAPLFDVTFRKLETAEMELAANNGYRVDIQVKPGLPLGSLNQTIKFQTNLPQDAEITINVRAEVISDVSVVGPQWNAKLGGVAFGIVRDRKPVERKLILLVRGEHRDTVEFAVESKNPEWLKVELGERGKTGGTVVQVPVKLIIPADAPASNFLGTEVNPAGDVILSTNLPELKQVRLKVMFAVEP